MMIGIDFMTPGCVVNNVLWRLKGLVFRLDVVGTDVFTNPGVVCRFSTVCGNTETGLVLRDMVQALLMQRFERLFSKIGRNGGLSTISMSRGSKLIQLQALFMVPRIWATFTTHQSSRHIFSSRRVLPYLADSVTQNPNWLCRDRDRRSELNIYRCPPSGSLFC